MMKERRPDCNALIGRWDTRENAVCWGFWVMSCPWLAPAIKWRQPKLAWWWHLKGTVRYPLWPGSVAWKEPVCQPYLNFIWMCKCGESPQFKSSKASVCKRLHSARNILPPLPRLSFQHSFTLLRVREREGGQERGSTWRVSIMLFTAA